MRFFRRKKRDPLEGVARREDIEVLSQKLESMASQRRQDMWRRKVARLSSSGRRKLAQLLSEQREGYRKGGRNERHR